jgi:hypothetical protein
MTAMTASFTSFAKLKSNLAWASLPLFDRTGWKRMALGDFAQSIGERAEPKDAQEEIYVGLEHLDPQCLHIRRWGKLAVAEFGGICSAHAMVCKGRSKMRPGAILGQ